MRASWVPAFYTTVKGATTPQLYLTESGLRFYAGSNSVLDAFDNGNGTGLVLVTKGLLLFH